jgi:hypothetical protein
VARSTPTPVAPDLKGVVIDPLAPSADGDILPAGNVLLVVACGATGTTVTIPTIATDTGLKLANGGGAVAANSRRLFGPFPHRLFAQPSDAAVGAGQVLVDYSSVTDVTRYVIAY